jgi:hypothetical protein
MHGRLLEPSSPVCRCQRPYLLIVEKQLKTQSGHSLDNEVTNYFCAMNDTKLAPFGSNHPGVVPFLEISTCKSSKVLLTDGHRCNHTRGHQLRVLGPSCKVRTTDQQRQLDDDT